MVQLAAPRVRASENPQQRLGMVEPYLKAALRNMSVVLISRSELCVKVLSSYRSTGQTPLCNLAASPIQRYFLRRPLQRPWYPPLNPPRLDRVSPRR